MAKSDSFFIRASVGLASADTFNDTTLDLGSYVDALGKSVLRIHNITASITSSTGKEATMAGNKGGYLAWQITTRDNGTIVLPADRSVVSSGQIWCRNADSATNPPADVYESDMLPQEWTNGYLIAVESMRLGAIRSDEWTAGDVPTVSVVLECTVETMTQASAMALALSQQGA